MRELFRFLDTSTAIFIDGSNTHSACKYLNFYLDYMKLHDLLQEKFDVLRPYYYTAIQMDEEGYSSVKRLTDWLEYNGFTLVTKEAKTYINNDVSKTKGNMDCELIVDALSIAEHVNHIILVSGDGDYAYLVKALQAKAVHVTVLSTKKTNPPMVSDTLRKQADHFVDLDDLKSLIRQARVAE